MTGRKTHPRTTYAGKALTEKRLLKGLPQQRIEELKLQECLVENAMTLILRSKN